jgi:F0F1-type ATP synthase gamma subunit
MKNSKALLNETRNNLDMKSLFEVYEELAALNIRRVKKTVLSSREYFDGLRNVWDGVGTDVSAVVEMSQKEAAVCITANAGLFGDIIDKTFLPFLEFIKHNSVDVYVVGKVGESLMRTLGKDLSYQTFYLADDLIDEAIFREIVTKVIAYKKVHFFYGQFKSVAVQNPEVARIVGRFLPEPGEPAELKKGATFQYIYEPSLWHVAQAFSEVIASVLEQVLEESQLAKFGSRVMHLHDSIENVSKKVALLKREKRTVRKKSLDKKQNSMISGILARTRS